MKIAILAGENQINYLKSISENIDWQLTNQFNSFLKTENVVAYFNLMDDAGMQDYAAINKPIFINSVTHTLIEKKHSSNIIRLNAWNGFLTRPLWEIAGQLNENHINVLSELNQKYTLLPDEPGFISARILSMIINEGFFAKEQGVSTEEEIDTAMKLGTNYPKGPFEWMREIGIKNIFDLLNVLSKSDSRYNPSHLLIKEANQ